MVEGEKENILQYVRLVEIIDVPHQAFHLAICVKMKQKYPEVY